MTGGRINWAGEEHFAYSRPSGPCLDRTFNAIVSICTALFFSAGVVTPFDFFTLLLARMKEAYPQHKSL